MIGCGVCRADHPVTIPCPIFPEVNTSSRPVHYHRGTEHRPVENCPFVDPEDGCCAHPSAVTPECWQVGPDRSDCPLRS